MGVDLIKTFASLAVVLGLIFLLSWAFKKYLPSGHLNQKEHDGWRLLGTKSIGPGRQVVVLEVGSKLLLIGVTDKSLCPLMEIDSEADKSSIISALSGKATTSFSDILKRSTAK